LAIAILKGFALLCSLYLFICSLDLLSSGFRIVGGRSTGSLFRNSRVLQNPIVGVMVGLLVTVLVQSSSTTTSILVGLVSAHIMTVRIAIPFVMGANIGTSITNAIVSLGQIGDRHQFKLAFAGACVHDAFNFLTVIVLLTLEVLTDFLLKLTAAIVQITKKRNKGTKLELLSVLTKPLVNKVVTVRKANEFLNCGTNCPKSMVKDSAIFPSTWSDGAVGAVVLVAAIVALFTCLMITVKILTSILKGKLAKIVKRTVNAEIPYIPWLAGYIAIFVGMAMTFLLQSSSVFTSAMTPLIGLGVISIDRAYPLTLGSNVGTCITALIASLAVPGENFYPAFQIALCHLFFNVIGIVIFYPIPFMRFPIGIAKFIGRETAKYRWFAIAYMLLCFFILPTITLGLSFAGQEYVIAVFSIVALICILIAIINILQKRKPGLLPEVLRTWNWLPVGLRSLKPYDNFFNRFLICRLREEKDNVEVIKRTNSETNDHTGANGEPDEQIIEKEVIDVHGDQQDIPNHIQIVNDKNEVLQPK